LLNWKHLLTPGSVRNEQTPVSPDPILTKYVDAVGGPAAIGKLTTRSEQGHITLAGRQFPVQIFSKVPDKRLSAIRLPDAIVSPPITVHPAGLRPQSPGA
jgi:hypothetical protein